MNIHELMNWLAVGLQFVVAGYALRLNRVFGPVRVGWSLFCAFSLLALLHLFLFRGVFPQQFTIIFLVLIFYAAEGLMRGLPGQARDWLVFSLATAGLIINHQPHALYAALYL